MIVGHTFLASQINQQSFTPFTGFDTHSGYDDYCINPSLQITFNFPSSCTLDQGKDWLEHDCTSWLHSDIEVNIMKHQIKGTKLTK